MLSLANIVGTSTLANALRNHDPNIVLQVFIARRRSNGAEESRNEVSLPSERAETSPAQQVEKSESDTPPKLHMNTVYHSFNCSDSECKFPLCKDAKKRVIEPMHKHALVCRSFKGSADRNCVVCQLMLQLYYTSFLNGLNKIDVAQEASKELNEWKKLPHSVSRSHLSFWKLSRARLCRTRL